MLVREKAKIGNVRQPMKKNWQNTKMMIKTMRKYLLTKKPSI